MPSCWRTWRSTGRGSGTACAAALDRSRRHLLVVERGLPDLPGILGGLRQRMEDRAERLALALPVLLDRKRGALGRLAPRLPHPREGIANRRAALAALHRRMEFETQRLLERGRTAEALVCFSVAPVQALLREKTLRLDGAAAPGWAAFPTKRCWRAASRWCRTRRARP